MAEKLKLEMVTPYKRVLSEEVDEVTAPGTVGEFGVLPDHTSLMARPFMSLSTGVMWKLKTTL